MLSIIIVNYKQIPILVNCINSIIVNTRVINYEILVVDNSNNGSCQKIIQQQFPFVKVLDTGYNAGFARANNLGIRNAVGDILLLLNSDTLITPSALDICENQFRQSSFVACGLQLLNEDLSNQMSGYHFTPGNFGILMKLPYIMNIYNLLKKAIRRKPSDTEGWLRR